MATIPLPALQIQNPPPPENPISQFARILQIKGLQQQQQLGQAQLQGAQLDNQTRQLGLKQAQLTSQDDEKWRAAMQDPSWDGSPEGLLKAGLKYQIGPSSWTKMSQELSLMSDNAAKAGSDQLKVEQGLADHIGDQLQSVQDAAPQNKLAAQQQAKQNSLSYITSVPGIAPQVRQKMLGQVGQIPDDVYLGDDALSTLVASNKLHSSIVDEALKKAQTGEATGKAAQAGAETTEAQTRTAQMGQVTPLARYQQQQENYRATLARSATLANELQKNGLGQLDKMFTDPQHGYTQFLAQAQSTKDTIANAKNGSQLAASMAPLMTALGVTSFAGIHRINQTEVNSAGPQVGSLYRRVNAILDKAGSGKLPAATTNEMGQLIDGLINAKHAGLVQGAQLVARNNGLDPSKTTVMDRDGNVAMLADVAKGVSQPARTQSGPPPGATHIAPGSDGRNHYTNSSGKDLGVAP